MKANEINKLLQGIYEKEGTTKEEKKALLEACGCVWRAKMNRVVDVGSFMEMLYNYMGFDYDVEMEQTEKETTFTVKTFKSSK